MKPFSQNVIFYDAEFSDLDAYNGELLSVALVKYSGEELYLELDYDGPVSEWVSEHMSHLLSSEKKISRSDARERIISFVGEDKPFLVAYVNQFDMAFWHKLFHIEDHDCLYSNHEPNHWIPIDFASILFGFGINPEHPSRKGREDFYRQFGIDVAKYDYHNALDDARLLRDVWMILEKQGFGNVKSI